MDDTAIARIIIEGNVEREGWAAMRRVVELLDNSFAKRNFVILVMARQYLDAGRSEDLEAISDIVSRWRICSEEGMLEFTKDEVHRRDQDGMKSQWKRKGLQDVINMADEEWLQELQLHGHLYYYDEEEDFDEEENFDEEEEVLGEDDMGSEVEQEDEENPGP